MVPQLPDREWPLRLSGGSMKRESISLAALVFLLVTVPLMFSQDLKGKPSPALPSQILGPQLIAWSQVQEPQPLTEPMRQADQQSPQTAQEPPQQQPAAQTLT